MNNEIIQLIKNEQMQEMKTGLYIVGTPIGNLNDITLRVIWILNKVDFIAAEDTRVSSKLLSVLGIKKPLVSYFEHNKRQRGQEILNRIESGQSCALITDAGMPAISDPGEDIVKLCHEKGVYVSVVPSATAVLSALAISGMDTGRFTFEGFLSTSKKNRIDHLESLKNEMRTIIFYEAPHKLIATLKDFNDYFGDRKISIIKELTKIHENVFVTTISSAIEYYNENPPKGEYVLIVEGNKNVIDDNPYDDMPLSEHLAMYINMGKTKKEAISIIAKDKKISKNIIYKEVLKLKD